MKLSKGTPKDEKCPQCGKMYDGIFCNSCNYTPYPKDFGQEDYDDDYDDYEETYYGLPFPRNIVTVPCYVSATILAVLLVLSFSINSGISFLMTGIICVLIAIGKGVNIIYMALESINDRIRHIDKSIKTKSTNTKPKITKSSIDDRKVGYMTFRVAGVTYDNDDGSSRQEIISQIKKDKEYNSTENKLDFKEYSYEGKPALAVFIDGKQVGNVPANRVDFLLEEIEKDHLVSAELEFLGGGDLSYGIKITLGIIKE